jgi:hypothetical protein
MYRNKWFQQMNPIKQGQHYYLTWESFVCVLLQKTTNDTLKTALRQLINITEQCIIRGNSPEARRLIDDEDFEFLDCSDFESEEENLDFPLDFLNDDDNLDELFLVVFLLI